ncbi:MAG: inorganic pyrophosphatase [Parcubacteria bacterium C7867-005]|nr:MAG: inorganic pyrophosphatase [Parcubacteria bacterium C7867-005]
MNLWHDIDPGNKDAMNVIIEINKGSKNKYEIDKKTGLIALDRVMHTGQDYPFDYGFVPQSLWHDGDPLDVVVLTTYPLVPGVLVSVRPVAVIHMVDNGEADEKIIAAPIEDPRFDHVKDLEDVNKHTIKEIEHFFLTYKNLQKKEVKINGIEGQGVASDAFEESLKIYKDKYKVKRA